MPHWGKNQRACRLRVGLLAFALILSALPSANSADYPDRPVRVVVPFAAAGVTDVVARVVFDRVAQITGKTFVIDNRPGAGGTIAIGQVINNEPDGYTLVMGDPSGSLPANITLYPNLKYDPRKGLAPIAIFGSTGAMLVVSNAFPARTIEELVAMAKAKPGELTYASTGIGTPGISTELCSVSLPEFRLSTCLTESSAKPRPTLSLDAYPSGFLRYRQTSSRCDKVSSGRSRWPVTNRHRIFLASRRCVRQGSAILMRQRLTRFSRRSVHRAKSWIGCVTRSETLWALPECSRSCARLALG